MAGRQSGVSGSQLKINDAVLRPRPKDEKSLEIEISDGERGQLSRIRNGVAEIRVYKVGLYPTVVSFVLADGDLVTIRAREVDIAPRFEVFPISATAESLTAEPEQVIDCKDRSGDLSIAVLRKAEWSVPTSPEDQAQLVGDPEGSTMQYEGSAVDVPAMHSIPLCWTLALKFETQRVGLS